MQSIHSVLRTQPSPIVYIPYVVLQIAIGNEHGFRLVSVAEMDVEYIDDDTAAQN
jgi:hypothetical protein